MGKVASVEVGSASPRATAGLQAHCRHLARVPDARSVAAPALLALVRSLAPGPQVPVALLGEVAPVALLGAAVAVGPGAAERRGWESALGAEEREPGAARAAALAVRWRAGSRTGGALVRPREYRSDPRPARRLSSAVAAPEPKGSPGSPRASRTAWRRRRERAVPARLGLTARAPERPSGCASRASRPQAPRAGRHVAAPLARPCGGLGRPVRPLSTTSGS